MGRRTHPPPKTPTKKTDREREVVIERFKKHAIEGRAKDIKWRRLLIELPGEDIAFQSGLLNCRFGN